MDGRLNKIALAGPPPVTQMKTPSSTFFGVSGVTYATDIVWTTPFNTDYYDPALLAL